DGGNAKVLVVEDNGTLQLLVAHQLKSLGLLADVAGTAEEGLQKHGETQYSLILMDCQLPHMDGFEAVKLIREREQQTGEHVPIVAMTAGAMRGDKDKCLSAGMDDYLAKPYTIEQLRAKMQRWIAVTTRA